MKNIHIQKITLILSILLIGATHSFANSLLGTWTKKSGPSNVLIYNYINDSTCTIQMDAPDTTITGIIYVLDTLVTPHRISWYIGGVLGNLGIWSISGDTLTVQGSGGDTTTFPSSFTDPSYYIKQKTGVTDNRAEAVNEFSLFQNYPNPFNHSTSILFNLSSSSYVSLKVFDLRGREVVTIVSEQLSAGNHVRQWSAIGMPSGIYYYCLQAGRFAETKKLVLMKQ